MVLLGACSAWSLITAGAHEGRPEGVLLAVLAVAAGCAAGRICGALLPVAAPGAAAVAGLALVATTPGLAASPQISAPLGHTGATSAVLTLSAGAACCAAWAAGAPAVRLALWLLAAGTAVTAAAVGSTPGVLGCAAVLLSSLAAGRMRHRGLGVAGLAVAAAGVTGTVWAIAAGALPTGPAAALEGPLTRHRVLLWRDALGLAGDDALLGVGPGRFGDVSQAAAQALPPDGKPHSASLQQAAEQGVVGMALLAAVFGWVLFALWRSRRSTAVVLTAGATLTALAVIASVSNALSFTAVSVGAGLVAGVATARPLAEGTARTPPAVPARGDRLVR
ncbi:hypothetical protein [Streptomyces sp. NPDC049915]|uniref:O-antigen ligase family protein n=1 Tax=Streptomyces sp. NPDC049915 TaxID=3155510 RepID=UPI0034242867